MLTGNHDQAVNQSLCLACIWGCGFLSLLCIVLASSLKMLLKATERVYYCERADRQNASLWNGLNPVP